jgi:hypothetical protein|tara:strand:+ start:140 stop:493 length:354 start_codon:yes stop_codon:yes gene_type:complete
MEWGQHFERLEKERAAGRDTPLIREVLDDRPRVYSDLTSIWTAFNILSECRPYISTGFGASPGPIPYEALDRYAQRHGPHAQDEFERFHQLIRGMDRHYTEASAKKANARSKDSSKG